MNDKVKSGKVKITNHGRANRIVYNTEGKPVIIPVGGHAVLFVSARQEKDLRASTALSVETSSDEVDRRLSERQAAERAQVPQSDDDAPETEKSLSASDLVRKAEEDSISYPALLREAKRVLGDDFPTGRAGGQPRKAELVRELRKKAKNDEE